jgi:limonene-1,2-epoxide hydrolase
VTNKNTIIQNWFDGLNAGDLEPTIALFDPHEQTITNAANPTVAGPDAAADVLREFFTRTTERVFVVHTIAQGEQVSFAHWAAQLTFAERATVAGHTVNPFTAEIEGVDTFAFNPDGLLLTVEILHQTTTVALAAAANAKKGTTA